MRIFDCFLYHNEPEMLRLRLEELGEVVDRFVLVQGSKTFTGRSRDCYIDTLDIPEALRNKLWISTYEAPDDLHGRSIDHRQRDHIATALGPHVPQDEDIVLVSDADEIPGRDAIARLRSDPQVLGPYGKARLETQFHYYFLDCLQSEEFQSWSQAIAIKWWRLKYSCCHLERTANHIGEHAFETIPEAAWHFSFFPPFERVWESIKSHADPDARRSDDLSLTEVKRLMYEGRDIFGRKWLPPLRFLGGLPRLPRAVTENLDYYRGLGWVRGNL